MSYIFPPLLCSLGVRWYSPPRCAQMTVCSCELTFWLWFTELPHNLCYLSEAGFVSIHQKFTSLSQSMQHLTQDGLVQTWRMSAVVDRIFCRLLMFSSCQGFVYSYVLVQAVFGGKKHPTLLTLNQYKFPPKPHWFWNFWVNCSK